MDKKLIAGIVVILVIIAAFLLFKNKSDAPSEEPVSPNPVAQSPTPAPNPTNPSPTPVSPKPAPAPAPAPITKIHIVEYIGTDFKPGGLTIKYGEAVRFVNKSNEPMWVASNPHPAHYLLAGFDQKASVSNGGAYQYTFKEYGTFRYHNHNNPSRQGTIVVQ